MNRIATGIAEALLITRIAAWYAAIPQGARQMMYLALFVLAVQAIRFHSNRTVLERIKETGDAPGVSKVAPQTNRRQHLTTLPPVLYRWGKLPARD